MNFFSAKLLRECECLEFQRTRWNFGNEQNRALMKLALLGGRPLVSLDPPRTAVVIAGDKIGQYTDLKHP